MVESGRRWAGQSFVTFLVVVCRTRIPSRIEDSRKTFIRTQSLHLEEETREVELLDRPPASVDATGS